MRTAFLLPVVLVLIGVGSKAFPEDSVNDRECQVAKEIMDHASNDFAFLRGNQITDNTWRGSILLPGSTSCYVRRTKRISYDCESRPYTADNGASDTSVTSAPFREERVRALATCLGPTWSIKTNMFSEFFSSVSDVEAGRTIIVTGDRNNMLDPPYIRTSFARMNQLPLDPPARPAAELRPSGYCDALNYFVKGAADEFQNISADEENRVGAHSFWKVSARLPGWNECYIHQWVRDSRCRYLKCSVGPVADEQQAEALKGMVLADTRLCIGSGWREVRYRTPRGTLGVRLVRKGRPIIELIASQSVYVSTNQYLDLSIRLQVHCNRP